MATISFKVSAKAARLIGRENITDLDGALIELIKNSYDADASCVYLKMDMPFPTIPYYLSAKDQISKFGKEDIDVIKKYYEEKNGELERVVFDEQSTIELSVVFFKFNTVIIIDNGTGMSEETVKNSWMQIGTSDKENEYISAKGRVKTGAKGIGRFALDKLSVVSKMYTAVNDSHTTLWELNWDQFTNAKLLDQVSAILEQDSRSYHDIVMELIGGDFNTVSKHDWGHGTAIILSPLREPWNEKQFKKTITAISSLNPFGAVDEFDIYINNTFFPEYNYTPQKVFLTENDFDYRIHSEYNGEELLTIKIERNEFDTTINSIKHVYNNNEKQLDLNTFWSRTTLQHHDYSRCNYSNMSIEIDLKNALSKSEQIAVKTLGPFIFDFVFSKQQNSDVEIVKKIPVRKRKNMYSTFSGIRLYRDSFKVRPYGEDGALFDWLEMGIRSQKSPAPISHKHGKWRVLPYQTLGSVIISRDGNPFLIDMANREGLVQNDQYNLLVKLCQLVLDEFESDRQLYYREYARWLEDNKPQGSEELITSIIKERDDSRKKNTCHDMNTDHNEKFEEEKRYKEAVLSLVDKNENQESFLRMLMAFGVSGILTNTFAHELQHIETDYGARNQQMRSCLRHFFKEEEFDGDQDFNPFLITYSNEKIDDLLSSWIAVLMNAFDSDITDKKTYNLNGQLNIIIDTWRPLLNEKHIAINRLEINDYMDDFPIVDWYIVLNNFILNSVWFLEHDIEIYNKEIRISVIVDETVEVRMFNNGPCLSDEYKRNPNKIFEAGESSKILNQETGKKGTGLGLWIVNQVVENNGCQIVVEELAKGFAIKMTKERLNEDEHL